MVPVAGGSASSGLQAPPLHSGKTAWKEDVAAKDASSYGAQLGSGAVAVGQLHTEPQGPAQGAATSPKKRKGEPSDAGTSLMDQFNDATSTTESPWNIVPTGAVTSDPLQTGDSSRARVSSGELQVAWSRDWARRCRWGTRLRSGQSRSHSSGHRRAHRTLGQDRALATRTLAPS